MRSLSSLSAPAMNSAAKILATRKSMRKKSSIEIRLPSTDAAAANVAASEAPPEGEAAGASGSTRRATALGSNRTASASYGLMKVESSGVAAAAQVHLLSWKKAQARAAMLGSTGSR